MWHVQMHFTFIMHEIESIVSVVGLFFFQIPVDVKVDASSLPLHEVNGE